MPEISITALLISLSPFLGIVWIGHIWAARSLEIVVAITRMFIQLFLIGYVLLFIFENQSFWIGGSVICLMVCVSALIGSRMVTKNRGQAFVRALVSIGVAGGGTLAFTLFFVLGLNDPWYQPRIIIPIAGMIFSNAMTAITLAAERLEKETVGRSDFRSARESAWTAAMIPQINALLAVGLVSIPGMMTGQILSGIDPLIAARYQIVVMAMIVQASGFSVAMYLAQAGPNAKSRGEKTTTK